MKVWILFLAFQPGQFVPEGFPSNGKYYVTEAKCEKAAVTKAQQPNVAEAKCVPVEIKL